MYFHVNTETKAKHFKVLNLDFNQKFSKISQHNITGMFKLKKKIIKSCPPRVLLWTIEIFF